MDWYERSKIGRRISEKQGESLYFLLPWYSSEYRNTTNCEYRPFLQHSLRPLLSHFCYDLSLLLYFFMGTVACEFSLFLRIGRTVPITCWTWSILTNSLWITNSLLLIIHWKIEYYCDDLVFGWPSLTNSIKTATELVISFFRYLTIANSISHFFLHSSHSQPVNPLVCDRNYFEIQLQLLQARFLMILICLWRNWQSHYQNYSINFEWDYCWLTVCLARMPADAASTAARARRYWNIELVSNKYTVVFCIISMWLFGISIIEEVNLMLFNNHTGCK